MMISKKSNARTTLIPKSFSEFRKLVLSTMKKAGLEPKGMISDIGYEGSELSSMMYAYEQFTDSLDYVKKKGYDPEMVFEDTDRFIHDLAIDCKYSSAAAKKLEEAWQDLRK